MKIGNTHKSIGAIWRLRRAQGGVSVLDVVYEIYPQTKQPMKKAKTFGGYMRKMARAGILREVAGTYYLTDKSRAAYHSPPGVLVTTAPVMRLVQD